MNFLSQIFAIVFALTVHEFSHAWMAYRLGDPTGKLLGRMSLNPLRHFDPLGTLALIIFHFGWGKPVPFNPDNLQHPKRDSALIGFAGPAANLVTAIAAAIPLKYLSGTEFERLPLYLLLYYLFYFSIVFFSLNILPLPPFDGSKIIGLLVPDRFQHIYDAYLKNGVTYVIIFILFDQLLLVQTAGVSVLSWLIGTISTWIMGLISLGT